MKFDHIAINAVNLEEEFEFLTEFLGLSMLQKMYLSAGLRKSKTLALRLLLGQNLSVVTKQCYLELRERT